MASYYPISPRFWSDPGVRCWSDDTRLLALYLLTCRHRSQEGLYLLPPEYAAADLRWPLEKFTATLAVLIDAGFAAFDEAGQVVLVRNALKYQPPKGAKQVAGALAAIQQLPETNLLRELYLLALTHSKPLSDALSKRYPTVTTQPEIPHRRGIPGPTSTTATPVLVPDTPSVGHLELAAPSPSPSPSPSKRPNSTVEPKLDGPVNLTEQLLQVFNTWIESTGRTNRTVLDGKRRRLIRRALDSFPVEDLVDAVQGWHHSPHHRGENDKATTYNDLELLLRDSAHIENFRDLQRAHGNTQANFERLLEEHPCSEDPDLVEQWTEFIGADEAPAMLRGSHPHAGSDETLYIGVTPELIDLVRSRFTPTPRWLNQFADGRSVEFLACPTLERSAA